ncbi:MAG: Rrf2 family transcriptional regulator [Gammaproteobacteria bacterium]|nr:Rrf2 family transcriptional regulator [Gammaproteobacteria bacterium]
MRLTTKGRYAVTAMLDLAIHSTERPTPLADISHRQGISLSYLEQLFTRLRKQELVKSTRGPGGGYRLSRSANEISVVSVLTAIDEKMDPRRCSGEGDCQEGQECLTHVLWSDLSDQIYNFLSAISLGDLVNKRSVQETALRQDQISIQQTRHIGQPVGVEFAER